MIKTHNLGYPRIGSNRELKKAIEAYWQGKLELSSVEQTAKELRLSHWHCQQDAGIDLIPVGDFSLYDQVLDTTCLLGVVPPRFNWQGNAITSDTYFAMARGLQDETDSIAACEMTKWFDTNYHYLVPEIHKGQEFKISFNKLFDEVAEAQAAGFNVKPVILGPLTWLWLAKIKGETFDKLELLEQLVSIYGDILNKLQQQGIEWVQVDEPVLVLDLPQSWQVAFTSTYSRLQFKTLKILLTTYFGELQDNLQFTSKLPVAGLHIDLVRGASQLTRVLDVLPSYKVLSLGVIDGRNIWRSDLDAIVATISAAKIKYSGDIWLAPSCSLLHVPVDLDNEPQLDEEIKSWLAFAKQKLQELNILKLAFSDSSIIQSQLQAARTARRVRKNSSRIHNESVKQRVLSINDDMINRHSDYTQRSIIQKQKLKLPLYPTTTIGSFPQTADIRSVRHKFKQGNMTESDYIQFMQDEISRVVKKQEQLGLDVLVHGEPERNDMVEYFGEMLEGFVFTQNGWVQSYGSRCVKPPIIYGDIYRSAPMTIDWAQFAQSCTDKPVKGMLTGPVTILNWSFVRDDQSRAQTAEQIALALRDEVLDLENAGIRIIQIDEAALREGLPLRRIQWPEYLASSIKSFRITACGVRDETQIHTHMCYSEFNDIIDAIANMDADVITIETSRSDMELLDAFENFNYPNEIGPGVYDIHSENIPSTEDIVRLMKKAALRIPAERLWINPDCGLKTRQWPEVEQALQSMINSALVLRN
ncbi:5-methyltetrahydropteroyltriglutamate--homocysteine methyltransferase [hydrothermal vent metagenome]|uniref:5-methyltetrahydropteroyltriglutamate--homocysteine S-methyltransferase n=1 Tax=hydrothermal vent metagenome TaxID=652676 RepID=A0A3B0ZTQ0_9ZZZZ